MTGSTHVVLLRHHATHRVRVVLVPPGEAPVSAPITPIPWLWAELGLDWHVVEYLPIESIGGASPPAGVERNRSLAPHPRAPRDEPVVMVPERLVRDVVRILSERGSPHSREVSRAEALAQILLNEEIWREMIAEGVVCDGY